MTGRGREKVREGVQQREMGKRNEKGKEKRGRKGMMRVRESEERESEERRR